MIQWMINSQFEERDSERERESDSESERSRERDSERVSERGREIQRVLSAHLERGGAFGPLPPLTNPNLADHPN